MRHPCTCLVGQSSDFPWHGAAVARLLQLLPRVETVCQGEPPSSGDPFVATAYTRPVPSPPLLGRDGLVGLAAISADVLSAKELGKNDLCIESWGEKGVKATVTASGVVERLRTCRSRHAGTIPVKLFFA